MTFAVVKNGTLAESVEVAGGATVTRTYLLEEDESAVFSVSAAGLAQTITLGFAHDCEAPAPPVTEVLGVTLTAPPTPIDPIPAPAPAPTATIPRTGAESHGLAGLAAGLVLAGVLLTILGRRRKRAA